MTTKAAILKTIRKHCIECCGGSESDVKNCTSGFSESYAPCALWEFRFGKDLNPAASKVEAGKRLGNKNGN